jgi:hypothetical protein
MDNMKELDKAIEILGEELVNKLREALRNANKNSSGNLIKSVDYKIIKQADETILQILAADYLEYVDEGVNGTEVNRGSQYGYGKKKMPNPKSLDKWIVRRGIAPRDKKGKFISRESVKFLIARSIGKNGIKGIHVVRKTIEEVYSKKQELIAEAVSSDIETMIDKIIIKK